MGSIKTLVKKSHQTLRDEGAEIFLKKASLYTRSYVKRFGKNKETNSETYVDVLFINGCTLPHPPRYRVSHQIEQLLAGNVVSNEVYYENLTLDMVKYARVFVFFRCPFTDIIGEFIHIAKQHNKQVVFDVDDLVIDMKYTDNIKYVAQMLPADKKIYDDGVKRICQTLKLCDMAITTTERLADELRNYIPKVYINRNVASEHMVELSNMAIYKRDIYPYEKEGSHKHKLSAKMEKQARRDFNKRKDSFFRLGYFSGSITHNDDFLLILPVVKRLMTEYPELELHVVGELDIPKELADYSDRIIANPFVEWTKLPDLIASVDVNLAPLENTIFNEAKSENKWVEAALVKVPTVASNVGAFKRMIDNGVTGFLCDNEDEWYYVIKQLIENSDTGKKIAEQAYTFVQTNCTTLYTGYKFASLIKSIMTTNIAFVLPTLSLSGGNLVVKKHISMLKKRGYDVLLISEGIEKDTTIKYDDVEIPTLIKSRTSIHGSFDKVVATLWSTLDFLALYPNIAKRYYLVQNYETNFYQPGEFLRLRANQTYNACFDLNYITISRWCENWLRDNYGKESKYARNGIDTKRFSAHKRTLENKIRILVEGNSDDFYKNVDESFAIIDYLDPDEYEVWYMSYQGEPKKNYRVDKFLHRVPYEKVPEVYAQCDILIKSSLLESFSYPPLEMMATGGYVVVAPNEGNVEYLVDGENCLFYNHDDLQTAVDCIKRIRKDKQLQERLYTYGIKTASDRDWSKLTEEIFDLYDVPYLVEKKLEEKYDI